MKTLTERILAFFPGAVLTLTGAVVLLPGVLMTGDTMAHNAQAHNAQEDTAIRASGKQIEQCQACIDAAENARLAARDLRAELQQPQPAWEKAGALQQRLHAEVAAMAEQHRRLASGLRPEQQAALEQDLRQMERAQGALAATVARMAGELERPSPSVRQLQNDARQAERSILEWKMRQQNLADRLHALR